VQEWALLRGVGPETLPRLFKASLSTELVVGIASAAGKAVAADRGANLACASESLRCLTRTPRFEMSVKFMSKKEQALVKEALLGWAEPALMMAYMP
jgi:hypothetical protein